MESHDIIIFGASGGIGQHLVKAFQGHRIIGTYNSAFSDKLEKGAEYHCLDVMDKKAVSAFTAKISSSLNKPVLIYTPGISPNSLVHKIKDEEWEKTISINLTGAMLASRGLLPRMRELNFGRIIFLSSVLSRISVPGTAGYSVSKIALHALAKTISTENAAKGITANVLALGYFDVGIINAVPEAYLKEKVIPGIPMGKLGAPDDIVKAVHFVMDSDYLSGAVLDINGGIIGT